MRIELSSLKSRVARRLFRMFFFIILVPIIFIAVGSFYKVSGLIFTEHHHHLQRATKEYGLGIFRRLSYAYDLLLNASQHTQDLNHIQPEYLHLLQTYFSNYAVAQNEQIIWQHNTDADTLDWQSLLQYTPNSGVFTLQSNHSSVKRVFITLATQESRWLAELDPVYLWPEAELSAFEELCVIGADSVIIFCSSPLSEDTIALLLKASPQTPVHWIDDHSEKMISASWSLFMRYQFAQDDWRIIISKPENVFMKSVNDFRQSFLPAILLIFLLVVFVSLYMVRRHLKPVEALIKGTKSLSENKLDYTVQVDTDDEYEDLAHSFNQMTQNLAYAFEYNTALFNINQKILLNENLSSCAHQILSEIARFATPLYSVLYILNKHNPIVDRYYTYEYSNQTFKQIKQSSSEILMQFSSILHSEACIVSNDEFSKLIPDLTKAGNGYSHYYPLHQDGQLISFLVLNLPKAQLDLRFTDFLSHCTVAFNALQRGKLLSYQAYFDRLTGVYNRSFLQEHAQKSLALTETQSFALLFVDLDRFKNINDTLGHSFGDELLKSVAKRLMEHLPSHAFLSRFGGDEFILLMPIATPADAEVVAQTWLAIIAEPFQLRGRIVNIGASIGISLTPDHTREYEALLTCADMAMYEAKSQGRNRYFMYSETLHNELARRTQLETFLREAVSEGYLSVYYQPKVNIQARHLSGFEALARFHHPQEGFIRPDLLFKIAEESGQVHGLGLAVMRQAFEQLKQWQTRNLWTGRMAINVSPLQLSSPDFVAQVESLMHETGVKPELIELEITEGVFIENNHEAKERLAHFQALGITIAMDDFGTGYSSMAYITQLPLNNLKIDKAFVSSIKDGNKHVGIIKSMIQIGQNLGLNVTAEGVETPEELRFLIEHGCQDIQGYLYSRPLSAQDAEALLITPNLDAFFKP
ncbi:MULTISPECIES: EAL domain-containing protein [Nitrincola]|uniref:Cyclic di-GMP phosphodiesterase Gmr n=1 Tax=Nitrincola nitratireducens TaxID=1229521 RepID=W9VAR7_9GAMM|nr:MULTISPECIES: EAL domain-containing protein [Nitrincola]EXJ13152.1 Cyclic di-GMP phosphodiesterase Gmr [Nitrincola nitratireducens]